MANVKWLTYTNSQFRFSIAYPDGYLISDERERPDPAFLSLFYRISFQDRQLERSDTANLQPPQAIIEVFHNEGRLSLENWLALHGPGGSRSQAIAGNLHGYRISLNILLAPNESFYFASKTDVYKLVLLGPFANQMLQSFKVW